MNHLIITKGPSGYGVIIDRNPEQLSDFRDASGSPCEVVATVPLDSVLSVAPALFVACKGLLDAIHDSMTHAAQAAHAEQIDAARAAIARAEGGAQ